MQLPSGAELLANALVTASIVCAARNSVHTWWSSIAGCAVFIYVFWQARLYADAVGQVFFIGAAVYGWWHWLRGDHGRPAPVRWTSTRVLAGGVVAGLAFGFTWAELLTRHTDAAAPLVDSLVLAFSIFAQLLLMARRVENWAVWIAVNTLAVPLFWWRELHVTAGLYAFYWFNAWWALFHWHRLAESRAAA